MAVLVVPYGLLVSTTARKVRRTDILLVAGIRWEVTAVTLIGIGQLKIAASSPVKQPRQLETIFFRHVDNVVQLLRPYGEFFHERTN